MSRRRGRGVVVPVSGEVLEPVSDEVWAHPVRAPVGPVQGGVQELRIVVEQAPAAVPAAPVERRDVSPGKRVVAYVLGLAAAVLLVVTLMAGPPWKQAARHHPHSTPDLVNPSR